MILANLTRAIREQNYYAVVLEFLIVIAGVVIGFQITAWNADRADRVAERGYLERLSEDMGETLQMMQGDIQLLRGWREDAAFTRDVLRSGSLDPEDQPRFERGLVVAHWLNYARGRFATLDELISTGRLTLIEDPNLRMSVGQLRSEIDNIQRMIEMISVRQTSIMEIIHTRVVFQDMMQFQIQYDFDDIAQDETFIRAFDNSATYLSTNAFWLDQVLYSVQTLKYQVDCELEDPVACEAFNETLAEQERGGAP